MIENLSISIVGRNAIDCHGLQHIISEHGFEVKHCVIGGPAISFEGWADDVSHIVIVDSASVSEALDRCTVLRAALPHARIIMMDDDCGLDTIREAFAISVDGILDRQIASKALVSAIELIALGEKVVPSQLVKMLSASGPATGADSIARMPIGHLSDREIEILHCLIAGDANKSIARKLSVAEATVKAHIKAILRKLHVENRTQAAIWAISRGMEPRQSARYHDGGGNSADDDLDQDEE